MRFDYLTSPNVRGPRLGDVIEVHGQKIGLVVAIRLEDELVVATAEVEIWGNDYDCQHLPPAGTQFPSQGADT